VGHRQEESYRKIGIGRRLGLCPKFRRTSSDVMYIASGNSFLIKKLKRIEDKVEDLN
jgi:hypothetical protein